MSKYELSHEDDALMNMIIDACGENGESVYKYKNKIRNIVRDYNMSLLPDKDKNRHLVRRLYEVDAGYGKILCGVAYKYIHENGNPCQVAPN